LDKAEADAHILRGYLKALDALDAVIALIRKSPTVDDAKTGLIKLLKIDDIQAMAILNLQLRRLAALERQKIMDQAAEIEEQTYSDPVLPNKKSHCLINVCPYHPQSPHRQISAATICRLNHRPTQSLSETG
jgi:hypothetical protein